MWGGADYDRIALKFAAIHDQLVADLDPRQGEDWLDLATGTGEVALRAARAGAVVTGVDIAQALLDVARTKAEREGLLVSWELGDAQALTQDDAAFDVVSSCFGVIFAPDHEATAAELARVTRPGGRLGLTCWCPGEGPHTIYERFVPSDLAAGADEWGKESYVTALLSPAFELEFEERVWHLTGDSPEDVWTGMSEGAPPVKALLESMEPDRAEEFRTAMIEYWEGYRVDGGVDEPRRYLRVLGRRR